MGTLKAHLSRANTQWQDFDPAQEALVVFQGPETYITPSWYAAKREHGKVVPTWNYAIVQAYGRIADQGRSGLAAAADRRHDGRRRRPRGRSPGPSSDAPAPFVAAQLKGIVGIEIEIARIEGKWKVSQNRSEADRPGVSAGLRLAEDDASQRMADMVDARGALPDG